MERIRENPKILRLTIVGVIILVVLCFVVYLLYQILFAGGGDTVTEVNTPTPTLAPTDEGPDVVISPETEEPTATPTRVISGTEEGTPSDLAEGVDTTVEPTTEPTIEVGMTAPSTADATLSTPSPTITPTPGPTDQSDSSDSTGSTSSDATMGSTDETDTSTTTTTRVVVTVEPGPPEELLQNDDFESFDLDGVAENWEGFRSEGAAVTFSSESEPYVAEGDSAQRITISQASKPDVYGGVSQTVEVIPSEPHTLTLQGQIRSELGDVNESSYGYRIQYAMDESGNSDWRDVPTEDWIELPWDEQKLHDPETTFSTYETNFTPSSEEVTVFVRGWNKWNVPGQTQYTLDNFSLIGPVITETEKIIYVTETSPPTPAAGDQMASAPSDSSSGSSEEEMVDKGLPTTGDGDGGFTSSGSFWGAMLIILLLSAGAVMRSRWGY